MERFGRRSCVRIDVADAVIREPLYREYWKISLERVISADRLVGGLAA